MFKNIQMVNCQIMYSLICIHFQNRNQNIKPGYKFLFHFMDILELNYYDYDIYYLWFSK